MADPFSIASGVAGLISLGLTVCNGIHAYLGAIEGRNDDIKAALQQLALLRSNIEIVESISSKLSTRHALATDGIAQSLKDCEIHFKALETSIQELTATGTSGSKQKWRKGKLIIMYPFNQKKLAQIHERLSKAKDTLDSFAQSLTLDVNVALGDDLRAFRADAKASDDITHEYLNNTKSRLDVIGPAVEHTNTELARILTRIEEQVTYATSSQALIHTVNSRLLEQSMQMNTIASFVEQMQLVHNSSRSPGSMLGERETTSQYMKNAKAERKLNRDLATMRCTCMNSKPRTVDRQSSHVYKAWASLAISKQVNVQNMHQSGCAFYDIEFSTTSTKTTLSYTGLNFLLRRTLNISLIQDSISRAASISFTLRPCRVVESSPAFLLFDDLRQFSGALLSNQEDAPEKEARRLMRELRDLYSSGNSSPFDIDQYGESIGHYCVKYFLSAGKLANRIGINGDALCTIISYLCCLGVPIATTHLGPRTILDAVIDWDPTSTVLPKVYDTVTRCFPGFDPTDSVRRRGRHYLESPGSRVWLSLNNYRERLDIIEAFGFEDLLLAIIRQDQPKLEAILEAPLSLEQVSQTDDNGRNVLHLSSDWAIGMGLLLKHNATHCLLNEYASFLLTPLDLALLYSKSACTARDQWTICDDCTCYMPARLLLEADCSVMVGEQRPYTLSDCSYKARVLFFEHFKDRRRRLLDIALTSLSPETLSHHGVDVDTLPDATAMTLYEDLQEQGHGLNPGLNPCTLYSSERFDSIFTYTLHRKVAELALNLGIQPFNDCKVPSIVVRTYDKFPDKLEEALLYADWLMRNGVNIDFCTDSFKLSVAHYLAGLAGRLVYTHCVRHGEVPQFQRPEITRVLLAISRSQVESRLPCPYITKPLNRPLAHFLFISITLANAHGYYTPESWKFHAMSMLVWMMQGIIDDRETAYLARCAVQILTYSFLGVRHLPDCYGEDNDELERIAEDPSTREEWAEIVDEDRPLIEQANTLTNELDEEFQRQNVSVREFLRGHWRRRMREFRRGNARSLTDSRKHAMREAGVVLDDTDDSSLEPDGLSLCTDDSLDSDSFTVDSDSWYTTDEE